MSKFIIPLYLISFTFLLLSCSINKQHHIDNFKIERNKLTQLKSLVEKEFLISLSTDSSSIPKRVYIANNLDYTSKTYGNNPVIQNKMKALGVKKIYIQPGPSNHILEIYFQKDLISPYPTIYYLYEYNNTSTPYTSKTISYHPIDQNWSLYIDSNFP